MAIDGTWNVTLHSPLGERTATLTLKAAGGALTGTMAAEGGTTEIYDGSVVADMVKWKVNIQNPMPLTLEFSGTVAGDKVSGNVETGAFGGFPFDGTRG